MLTALALLCPGATYTKHIIAQSCDIMQIDRIESRVGSNADPLTIIDGRRQIGLENHVQCCISYMPGQRACTCYLRYININGPVKQLVRP
ncbi:hypothetical protein F4859DRAFT_289522 [Xylaria cf. heliscus]|nr:hypothetical protein F4859DRAFT_289522 [Xylaria cf. heliscus]